MILLRYFLLLSVCFLSVLGGRAQNGLPVVDGIPYAVYPAVLDERPGLPSPFLGPEGQEYVVAVTKASQYAIIPVTLTNAGGICLQLVVDTVDFPDLARAGLHDAKVLDRLRTITGWTLDTITQLGRPGNLSQGGFLAADETILSVIKGDDRLVRKMGLTHPKLAKPLFHVLNMMDADLSLERWNMAKHQWDHFRYFYYNGKKVWVTAEDTKGGQQSIFNDGISGGFYIRLWREFDTGELRYLEDKYGHLERKAREEMQASLSLIHTGEMQPQYIMRYGFYEGHTYWRTDPLAIAFIFGLKSLEELDQLFSGELDQVLLAHFIK